MSRKVIEIVQVLVDRIEKGGYQQRAREENAFDLNKRLTEAEGWVAHWKQARQDAHEAGELMRAEIETLRKELDATNRLASTVASERDAAHAAAMAQQRDETVYYLQARLDEERSVIAGLRQQLDAANAAVTLQRAGIDRLQAFVGKVRRILSSDSPYSNQLLGIEAALKTLDAGTEPTPVAERCPECDGSGVVDSGGFGPDGKAISVPCGGDCRGKPCPSQPTPVAEPLDAEGGA